MARPKHTLPEVFQFEVRKMFSISESIKDNSEFGAFCRKGIIDLLAGCVSDDVDAYVKEIYDKALRNMISEQNKQSTKYAKFKKIPGAVATHTLNTSASRTTISEDVENSDASKDCKPRTSSETSTPASIRKAEDEHAKRSNASQLESGTDVEDLFKSSLEDGAKREGGLVIPSSAPSEALKKFGELGLVTLSAEEERKLRELYGESFDDAVATLENYLANNPKKLNGKDAYKSHYFVMRKNNWVHTRFLEKKLLNARINNASQKFISFQEQERQRTARALRGESIDGRITVKDEDLTPEEFKRIYVK